MSKVEAYEFDATYDRWIEELGVNETPVTINLLTKELNNLLDKSEYGLLGLHGKWSNDDDTIYFKTHNPNEIHRFVFTKNDDGSGKIDYYNHTMLNYQVSFIKYSDGELFSDNAINKEYLDSLTSAITQIIIDAIIDKKKI